MTEMTFLEEGPVDAGWTLLLAHGAGQGMNSPFMDAVAQGLGRAGIRVLRFNFPYMAQMEASGNRRPPDRMPVLQAAFVDAINRVLASGVPRSHLLIGGKSMGGRMASLIADIQGVAGLICLGYPFHPPGRPESLRTGHLATLRTPTLICQGERDPFGRREEVAAYDLSPHIRVAWLPDGEHSFKPRKASGLSEADNLDQAVHLIVDFIAGLER